MMPKHAKIFVELMVAAGNTWTIDPDDVQIAMRAAKASGIIKDRKLMMKFLPIIPEEPRKDFLKDTLQAGESVLDLIVEKPDQFYNNQTVDLLNEVDHTGCSGFFKSLTGVDGDFHRIRAVVSWLKAPTVRDMLLKAITQGSPADYHNIAPTMKSIVSKSNASPSYMTYLKGKKDGIENFEDIELLVADYDLLSQAHRATEAKDCVENDLKDWALDQLSLDDMLMEQQLKDGKDFEAVVKEYEDRRKIEVLPYQVSCIKHISYVTVGGKKCCVMEIPTGSGKSVITSGLAHVLLKLCPGSIIIVVLPTSFLKHVAYTKYSFKRDFEMKYPAITPGCKILYIEAAVFAELRDEFIKDKIIIVDEIEQCFIEKQFQFTTRKNDGKRVATFVAKKLGLAKTVIGLTGTFHEVSRAQIKSFLPGKELFTSRVNPVKQHAKFTIEKVVPIKEGNGYEARRLAAIIKEIDAVIDDSHVIVIDEELKAGDVSALAECDGKSWQNDVHVFNSWSEGAFEQVMLDLDKIRKPTTGKKVLHVSLQGIRGVDYRLGETAVVICAYNVANITMLMQCGGRGARIFTDKCNMIMIVPETSMLAKVAPNSIVSYLTNLEQSSASEDGIKRHIIEAIDGEVPTKEDKKELAEVRDILVNPQRKIHASMENPDPIAKKNYIKVRSLFPGLPDDQMELIFNAFKD